MKTRLDKWAKEFEEVLLGNFAPFWTELSPDYEYGGYLCGFMRDGELFYEDKSVWQQGRSLWMFSKLYNEFGKKQEWLDCAKCGYDFINKYCFADNGHMYFRVTRDGKPLVERRYYFSEAFAVMGYAEYYKATGLQEAKERAIKLFDKMLYYYTTPGVFPAKVNPKTRKNRGHSIVMIMMNVAQCMREIDDNVKYDEVISNSLDTILNMFVKEDEKALFETVEPNGARLNTPDGRFINPGHSLETAWFMMKEAVHRKDASLMEKCIKITEWSIERGWDKEKGGMFYFVDVENKPVLSLEWDMKLLWVHCEAMIALTYAYWFTKDEKYLELFDKIKSYVFAHFPDEGHPEWFGHLHRDGTPINYIKGSDWKGPFHNVRAFMILSQLLTRIANGEKLEF
ncbi:MAG: N-acylglucosamine 2-epimerase [Clostridiales bacterium]|nr:N-acylglucosamine 2-epimerase [Clostridiales bacterium]